MPWNGAGQYNLPPAFTPEVNGNVVDATRYNGALSDIASGISNAFAKDGQNVPTSNLKMGGFRLTGLGNGVSAQDAATYGQLLSASGGGSVDNYGAVGDGVADDTAAFVAAFAAHKYVFATGGKNYLIGDVAVPINGILDLRGAQVLRKNGSVNALNISAFRSSVVNGYISGNGFWRSSTLSAASAGVTAVVVASAAGLAAGMKCFYESSWAKGGIEANEISSVVGTTVNLKLAVKGNIAANTRFLADFPIVKSGNSQYSGELGNVCIRNALVGFESGNNSTAGATTFLQGSNIFFEDIIGANLVVTANVAAENFISFRVNGGKTQTSTFAGTGSQVRFAVPWILARKCYRWGVEPTIRVFVNGTKLATTAYTVDLTSMEVVLNTAPALAAVVVVQNYEYAAFGILGLNIGQVQGSSVERLTAGLVLCCNIGSYYENCELGFIANVQNDTCGFAGTVLVNSRDFYIRAYDNLYSPFGVIIDEDCDNISLGGGWGTSLIPDSEELTPTVGKKELIVEALTSNVQIDYLSWHSKNGFSLDVAGNTYATGASIYFLPNALAVGGVPSGLGMFYGTSSRFAQITADADEVILGGGSGTKYFQGKGTNVTTRLGSPESGGKTELVCGVGVRLTVDDVGNVILNSLPTTAPAVSGAIWRDASAGNVIKQVP